MKCPPSMAEQDPLNKKYAVPIEKRLNILGFLSQASLGDFQFVN